MDQIKYRAGYKYQLSELYKYPVPGLRDCIADYDDDLPYCWIEGGVLYIRAGYAWDGATGCPDVDSIMRGSLVHDALYQLIRDGLLPAECRDKADRLLQSICIEDGMPHALADVVYAAVSSIGSPFADPRNFRPVMSAPYPEHERLLAAAIVDAETSRPPRRWGQVKKKIIKKPNDE